MKKIYPSLLLFGITFMAVAQSSPLVHITIDAPAPVCNIGECSTLFTEYLVPSATTDYAISSIAYNPLFPFTGGTTFNATGDDTWSSVITLPFSFSFYGTSYNSLLVGTNGVVTFDQTNQIPSGYCNWPFTQTIPNPTFPIRNAIYGVYQDTNIASPPVTNPMIQNVNYYVLSAGVNAAPNRVFVVNFNELPQFQCNSNVGLQTSQIVLYESTNIIDVFVKSRTSCTSWNSGSGLIGIQNQAGTAAVVAPGRNTGTWSATNEAWRISPNGAESIPTFAWYNNGVLLANEFSDSLIVCPNGSESYSVSMQVLNPDNSQTTVTSNTVSNLLAPDPGLNAPADITVCTESPFIYTVDLTTNTNLILGALNPNDYEIAYYDNLTDAQNVTNNFITNPVNYSFTENKTIYVSIIEAVQSGCNYIKTFSLSIIPVVTPPTGEPNQNFLSGQTLADLNVSGENLVWYDDAIAGNILSSTTLLQDDTTYYATQTISGCESNRNANANRFAVTVNLVLSNETFAAGAFTVYPNPVGDLLSIVAKENLKTISIYNTIGQEILQLNPDHTAIQISTSTWNAGVYFLKINSGTQSQTLKIIKN